ncbi:MAG: ABC transporter permease, partial [Nitrospinales bacterium]
TLVKAAPYEYKDLKVKFGNSNTKVTVAGTTPDFLTIRKYAIEEGRFFNEQDLKQSRRMAVIGKTTAKNIFGDENPMGQVLRIGDIPFTVIGIFREKGMDTDGVDQDDILIIPLNTLLRRILNQNFVTTIYFQVDEKKHIDRAVLQIRDLLRERHRLREEQADDFSIQTQLELEELKKETAEMFTSLIVGVAAISLVVGGIGIMAVMLISVKERTREIGVRRAVGATRIDIVQQFIMESVAIGFLGGSIGIILGVGITLGLGQWSPWTLVLNTPSIVISSGVCILIGMVFGIFPAFKASRLDPMAALKIE